MNISRLAQTIEPSKGRYLFELAARYDNVINFTLGDPDIIPPLSIRQAGCDAIMRGATRYSANAGIPELRRAYAAQLEREYGAVYDPASEIIVTVGGMEGLYLALLSVVDPGDEVIIFSPCYMNYYQMVRMCGGIPVVVDTPEKDGYIPRLDNIEKVLSDRTKLILMCSPNNPTAAVFPGDVVTGIVRLARDHDLFLISDEVYSTLYYGSRKPFSVLESPVKYDKIMLIDSCSKKFAMTGWRVGFATGPAEWVAQMIKFQEYVVACAPLPSQYAALEAFGNPPDMSSYVGEFKERRDALTDRLSRTGKLSFLVPEATFYLFVNISQTGMKSMDFAIRLLEEKQVAVSPGLPYGDSFDDYIRLAFTLKTEVLIEAADKIVSFVEEQAE